MLNKKILAVLMKWDYGIQSRGRSEDQKSFGDSFEKLCNHVDYLWFDEYFDKIDQLQRDIVIQAEKIKYDLIFVLTFTDQFTFETLDLLKKISPTVGWFGDDQWRFEEYSSKYAQHYSYVLTTDPWSVKKYQAIGISPILTQWAGYSLNHDKKGPIEGNAQFLYDVSFIGQYNPFRNWFLKELQKSGIMVKCFGPLWPNGRLSTEEMVQTFQKSRINLNISNSISHDIRYVLSGIRSFRNYLKSPKRVEQPKARNFEIPLAGGFQLTNYFLGLERYFTIGNELALYNTPEECIKQIRYYLENEENRNRIAINGHIRAKNEHTYYHRLKDVLQKIWPNIKGDQSLTL